MIEQTLRQTFGYDGFRAGQEQAIRAVVAGRSAAAIFPTGSGKSLCYQLPALLDWAEARRPGAPRRAGTATHTCTCTITCACP